MEEKAMYRPSGDHVGLSFFPCCWVILLRSEPSARMVKMSRLFCSSRALKAMTSCFPQSGFALYLPRVVSLVTADPSAFMV